MPKRAAKDEVPTPPFGVVHDFGAAEPYPVVLKRREDAPDLSGEFRKALTRIASGRLCGCRGDHDRENYDCPKSIARSALEGA
jgi:hypothetical protein